MRSESRDAARAVKTSHIFIIQPFILNLLGVDDAQLSVNYLRVHRLQINIYKVERSQLLSCYVSSAVGSSAARWLWCWMMAAHGWRLRSTSVMTFTIIAGTLAAAHYRSIQYHCAIGPNSGSEHSWGLSLTQDSRDSDFYSGCHSNKVGGEGGSSKL